LRQAEPEPIAKPGKIGHQPLRAIFWSAAAIMGALYAWIGRHAMNPDGVSYLDMADSYLRGDWGSAINAYWSPFYSWLLGLAMFILKPSPYWEFPVVHLVNFVIFLGALGCFDFFLRELLRYNRKRADELSESGFVALPEWLLLGLGYTLFIWISLSYITLWIATPDMCVAAFVYLISGMLLRIRMGYTGWPIFILLGVVLGLGYLAKAAMFPLAFIFLASGMLSVGNLKRAVPRMLIALVVFLSVAGPFIGALSLNKGRPTIGDSGKLNYSWYVNGTTRKHHWQGDPPGSGAPKHPTRKIHDSPAIYEFGAPVGGTYPAWYDPPYWYEGVDVHFDLNKQVDVLRSNAEVYFNLFFYLQGALIAGILILFYMSRRWWLCLKDIIGHWNLLIPVVAALSMYAAVTLELRYVAPFILILWMVIYSGIRLSAPQRPVKLATYATAIVLLTVIADTNLALPGPHPSPTLLESYHTANSLISGESAINKHWEAANALNLAGVQPGDKVAYIGNSFGAYWARLAGVQIVAEMPDLRIQGDKNFWDADDSVKSEAIRAFAKTDAKVIVAYIKARDVVNNAIANGWRRLGNTNFYIYNLPDKREYFSIGKPKISPTREAMGRTRGIL